MTTTICTALRFLSTLSLRRATSAPAGKRAGRYYFYPRSPCGERHQPGNIVDATIGISIHALLAESDCCCSIRGKIFHQFLSTLSLRRATLPFVKHLLLKEFLSTLSLRRATYTLHSGVPWQEISIHALLAESDRRRSNQKCSGAAISIHALLAESDHF